MARRSDTTNVASKEKKDPMLTVLANIEKQMGNKDKEHPIITKASNRKEVQTISFGYPAVDKASFCGGVPRGKLIEIFGYESGGKSYLSLKLIGSAQNMGLRACLVDAEQSYDPAWASQHGVNVDDLYIVDEPMSAEKTLDYIVAICESGAFGIVVIDSCAALVPATELQGSIADQNYALLARAMSKACNKIVHACGKTGTTCVFLNQLRDKMGVVFGDPSTTPGGKALKFYSHQRIQVIPSTKIKVKEGNKDVVVARQSIVKFVKNKVSRPWGECIIEIVFDSTALNPVVRLCNAARNLKVIDIRKGEFKIPKELSKTDEVIATGTSTFVGLADWLVKNDYVTVVLNAVIEEYEKRKDDVTDIEELDEVIMKMKDDPSLIVSPLSNTIVENVVVKPIDGDKNESNNIDDGDEGTDGDEAQQDIADEGQSKSKRTDGRETKKVGDEEG